MPAQMSTPLRIFIQLNHGYGARNHPAPWRQDALPAGDGFHTPTHNHMAGPDVFIEQSEYGEENILSRLFRYGIRSLTGFDFMQAWRNRGGILSADVVWTLTEAQALAVLLLYRLTPLTVHPPLIAQSVWLMDRWPHEPLWRRLFMRSLLSRVDLLTFVSAENMKYARTLFPGQRMEWVGFPPAFEETPPERSTYPVVGQPLRVLSLGTDPQRDWISLLDAVAHLPRERPCNAAVGTIRRITGTAATGRTVAPHAGSTFHEHVDILVLSLTENLHPDDMAVIEDAARYGVPVIATDTESLRHYFDDHCVLYVPPDDPAALARAITALASDVERCRAMLEHIRARIRTFPASYAHTLRHVAFSRELMGQQGPIRATFSANKSRAAQELKITIGIATSGRPTVLRETIAELRAQSHPPQHIIICAPTPKDVAGLEGAPDLTLIMQAPRGLAHQRNVILDLVTETDIVMFFDDDFLPDRDYLAQCAMAFATAPDIVVTTGRVLADGAKGPGLTVEAARAMLADPHINNTAALPALQPAWNGYGCNMAYRLSTIRQAGLRFDERLPLYAWYEDIDFSRQMGRLGRIVRVNGAKGVHLGSKLGRTPGRRLGYSQVANPLYLSRKGTFPLDHALRSIGRNIAMNAVRSLWSEPYIDRRGRIVGNWLALRDAVRGRISPENILTL